jgi:hypothetical protein
MAVLPVSWGRRVAGAAALIRHKTRKYRGLGSSDIGFEQDEVAAKAFGNLPLAASRAERMKDQG